MKKRTTETVDVVVVGAGHAGCEAALACARLGLETVIFTVSVDSIAMMPCNPNIGGSSKGHLVREVDALGGEMGVNIDHTFIQSKMLNRSKGPAVHSLRAQADKAEYSARMRQTLENQEHLTIRQMEVTKILCEGDPIGEDIPAGAQAAQTGLSPADWNAPTSNVPASAYDAPASNTLVSDASASNGLAPNSAVSATTASASIEKIADNKRKIIGVETYSGAIYYCKAVVLCTGTYLRARCIYGDVSTYTGPNGLQAANFLTQSLLDHGIEMYRFKTGTPARMDGKTIDYTKMERQDGDVPVVPFSFETDPKSVQIEQVPVWLTYTNEKTHEIIRANLDRSPLYSGVIHGTGPRYCPSIEDKVVRFADKDRHQVFIEPEGLGTNEMYVGGMSSSLPEDVQIEMYHTVPGLEHARIVKNAYAIEYDCINAMQLNRTFEFKNIPGLFAAGQFNGSSGYEEAAAQGLYAGINAAMKILGKEPLLIDRSEGYLGVLVDDLISKENHEPYRMMTSRAEYRLLLRQDNADLRLTEKGYRCGLVSEERWRRLQIKKAQIEKEIDRVEHLSIGANREVAAFLESAGSSALRSSATLAELIRRPELNYDITAPIDPDRPELSDAVREEVNIEIKYKGYIERERKQVEQFRRNEAHLLPEDLDYSKVKSLRTEARQKLEKVRPASIGQASRIPGVNPADISVLLVYLHSVT